MNKFQTKDKQRGYIFLSRKQSHKQDSAAYAGKTCDMKNPVKNRRPADEADREIRQAFDAY